MENKLKRMEKIAQDNADVNGKVDLKGALCNSRFQAFKKSGPEMFAGS